MEPITEEGFVLPASFAQQRLWFLDRLEPDGALYNVPLATRLRGPLNVDALARALSTVVERHESLRTTFRVVDGVLHQLIAPPRPLNLPVTDLSGVPDAERRAIEFAETHARRPFDLYTGPLIRAALVKVGEDDHVLSLLVHHIVADGWSMNVLNREVTELYGGYADNAEVELPELEIQYGDYAVWQRDWMRTGGLDDQLSYWKRQLAGAPSLLDLPTDFPRPARQSFRGATVRRMLPLQLLEGARALGEREGTTLFMTLLAAFAALLSRYSGLEDVVVGSPVANRNRLELESVIGFLVNTLALRIDLEGNPSFIDLLHRVRETALGAFSNQDVPFEKLVEELNPERHLSHAPVAQVLFVLQSAVDRPVTFAGITRERITTDRGTAKFDLSLFTTELPDGLRVSLEYCTDLFEDATARRILEHYAALLEHAIADPSRPVGELGLLSDEERALVVGRWSQGSDTDLDARERPVHQLVCERARRSPDAVAIRYGDEQLSYAELDRRANQLARHLRSLGVGPDVVVAVCAERAVETVVALLAVLKAGGAYAPIDPDYPEERVAFMLADTDTPVLLTQRHLLSRLPATAATTVCLDADFDEIAGNDDGPVDGGATLENLAYVLYTSGSTGQPKGVAMEHRPLANLLAWQFENFSGPAAARTLQFASLSFDVGFQEVFSTWCSGGTLVLVEECVRRDPEALLALVREQQVERLFLPFVALHGLCETAEYLHCSIPSLREVITAGEQLKSTESIRSFFARHPDCTLTNQYGPTESHVVTAFRLGRAPAGWPALPPIGRPIAGARIYLLGRHQQPVPIGVPGELHIGGVSLARGYLGRPELTRDRFVRDPFSDDPGARLYRTGDLARYRSDGNIDFLGRADHQVKIRGFRIEPGEVEAALRRHPGVREALVTARADDHDERRLVAYVIPDGMSPTADDLREFLATLLPDYMIPSAFASLDAFPVTPNGKVDRNALPAPADHARGSDEYVAARTELERALVEIWQHLLKVERVGIHDNFFALGGHSLLATQLVSRVRDVLDVELPLRVVFESPTVASFGRAIEEVHGAETKVTATPAIQPATREWRRLQDAEVDEEVCVLPASFAEQRLWFLDRLEPSSGAYKLALARRLHGRLDVAALERALTELIARHECLRTTFAMFDNVPRRVVHRPRPVALSVTDLRDAGDVEGRAQALVATEAARGFDLEVGPLLRVSVFRLDEDEHILLIALHHIIVDGWSIGVLNRELGVLYGSFVEGREPQLPELALQYADYAAWQRDWMAGGGMDGELGYWKQQLSGAPALLELPTNHPRPSRQSFRGATVRTVLPVELLGIARELGEREGVTLFMTLLTAFGLLLSRYSGQEDIVVASSVANRERSELEGLIGFFVNTLPLRIDLSGEPSFRELLTRVRETALAAYSNQDLPFEKLVEELNPKRHLSYSPVAQVFFLLQTAVGDNSLELAGLMQEPVHGARLTTKFDVSMYAVESPEGLRLSLEYATDLFEEATMRRMLDHYRNLLEHAISDPEQPVSQLRMLGQPERTAVLAASEATGAHYQEGCLHELFERRAAQHPDAVAVTCGERSISYGELNRSANQLAHRLRALGARAETMIALLLEPSLEMVVAILGTLKAGAAYVPLDPEAPSERLDFMLTDTGAPVVVAQQRLVERLPGDPVRVVCLDADRELLAEESPLDPDPLATPESLAYVIYTSGSTGQPKGVQVEHRQVARLFTATDAWYRFDPSDTWTLLHSYAFDFSVWELWGALLYGGRVVISPRSTTRSPQKLARLVADQQVTVLNATPSLFAALQPELLRLADRLALRLVVFGGEALQPAMLRQWFERHGTSGPALVNMYGITETTVHVTYRPLSMADCERAGSPIGVPIPDLAVYLLDRSGEPAPPGVAGEMFVGGAGVARGYLNRPELTAARFVANPFGPGRLYRTGDLARRLPTGELEFHGRTDDQVKIRGFRIELGEVRAALTAHPAVKDAVVTAHGSAGDARLAAYVVPAAPGPPPGADELRAFLARRLPQYMIPAAWLFLDALPLTRNGKVDLKSLPLPEYDRAAAGHEYVPPSTGIERALAQIWSNTLGIPKIGVADDFFELGGHSMLAVALFAEIERKLGARLPLSALFESATIGGLARIIESERRDSVWSPLVRMRQGNGRRPLFLIAWAGGEVLPYRDLVEKLDPDLPVYGLRAPGVDHRTPPLSTVEQLAAYYIRELRQVQAHGPYRLGGYCFSGLVAYEMAGQLIGEGETVDLLALLDAQPYQRSRRPSRLEIERVKWQQLKSADMRGKWSWVRTRAAAPYNKLRYAAYQTTGLRVYELLASRELHYRIPRRPWNLVLVASNLARHRYEPPPLDVRVEYFHAQRSSALTATPWDRLALRGVTLRPIVAPDIDHVRMMKEPHVRMLAEQLGRALNDGLD